MPIGRQNRRTTRERDSQAEPPATATSGTEALLKLQTPLVPASVTQDSQPDTQDSPSSAALPMRHDRLTTERRAEKQQPNQATAEPPSPAHRISFGSPPRELPPHGLYHDTTLFRVTDHARTPTDTYSVAGSPPTTSAQPIWMNGMPTYRPPQFTGISPPAYHSTGQSPPSHVHRPMSGHSLGVFQHTRYAPARAGYVSEHQPRFHSLDFVQVAAPAGLDQAAVVLVAKEPLLEVYQIHSHGTELIGRLGGITGRVLDARILAAADGVDLATSLYPLVALVLLAEQDTSRAPLPNHGAQSDSSGPRFNAALFKTRVEVYSLVTGKYVGFLYESPPVACDPHMLNALTSSQTGDLQVESCGKFIVVASGASGEVFCFVASHDPSSAEKFRCIAKYWTTIRSRRFDNRPQSNSRDKPIFTLGSRWLAIVPPSVRSRQSISGTVPTSAADPKPYGVETNSAPLMPSVDSTLDVPNPDGFATQVARGVAQEVFKGAKWVGSQGLSAWNSYFNKPQHPQDQPSNVPQWSSELGFPPTHAGPSSPPAAGQVSAIVSIIDLDRLVEKHSKGRPTVEPFVTFEVPGGCAHLAFSPSGLRLLTINDNGDTQNIWGLMKAYSSKGSTMVTSGDMERASVSQLAKFTRFTPADMVDVAWSSSGEDNIALLSDRGTVHIYRLPSTVFSWPLFSPRRKSTSQLPRMTSNRQQGASSALVTSHLPMKSEGVFESAAALVRKRSNTSSISTFFGGLGSLNITASTSIREGRRVASEVGKTATAAADALRHADEDRFRISLRPGRIGHRCIQFMPEAGPRRVVAISDETIKIHEISFGGRPAVADGDLSISDAEQDTADDTMESRSFWQPSLLQRRDTAGSDDILSASSHPLACAEIDPASSCQPFFSDRRFVASTFIAPAELTPEGPWSFGLDIPTRLVHRKQTFAQEHAAPAPATSTAATSQETVDPFFGVPMPQSGRQRRRSPTPRARPDDGRMAVAQHALSFMDVERARDQAAQNPIDGEHDATQHDAMLGGLDDSALMEHMASAGEAEDEAGVADDDVDFSGWNVDADDLLA